MKKILSIMLSVMMVAGLFTALVPTVSAETGPAMIADSELTQVYTQNFEETDLAGKTNHDLTTALGWVQDEDITNDPNTTWSEASAQGIDGTGTAELVTQDGSTAIKMTITGQPDGYGWNVQFFKNDALKGGDYVIEYTQTHLAPTTGSGFGMGMRSNSAWNNGLTGYNFANVTTWQTHLKWNGGRDMHLRDDGAAYTGIVGNALLGDNIVGQTFTLRTVVSSTEGVNVYLKNGNAWDFFYGMDAKSKAIFTSNASNIPNGVCLCLRSGASMILDDIKVYTFDNDDQGPADADLLITEVTTDAMAEKGADFYTVDGEGNIERDELGNIKHKPDGVTSEGERYRYEYIEVYNASTKNVNVYDYVVAQRQGLSAASGQWNTINTFQRIRPGANITVTRTSNNRSYTYGNPAYEQGVLAPGQTALLVIPNNWWSSTNCSIETFKALYLKNKMGMSDDEIAAMKLFTLADDANTDQCMGIDGSNSRVLAMVKASDIPAGSSVEGKYAQELTEGWLWDSMGTDGTTSITVDGIARTQYTVKELYSAEYKYWDAAGNFTVGGVLDTTRLPSASKTSIGYVPTENRRPFTVTLVDGKNETTDTAYLATAYTPKALTGDATKTFAGWVDAQGNKVTEIAAAAMLGDVTLYATWDYTVPHLVGYQTTKVVDGRYDMRVVAVVDNVEALKGAGFTIAYSYGEGASKVEKSGVFYCHYIYDSITENYGAGTITAEDLKHDKIVVMHITGCYADRDITFTVSSFGAYDNGAGGINEVACADTQTFTVKAAQ